jgi:hypothetical protein
MTRRDKTIVRGRGALLDLLQKKPPIGSAATLLRFENRPTKPAYRRRRSVKRAKAPAPSLGQRRRRVRSIGLSGFIG